MMAVATAGTPSVCLWDDVARAYATRVPQVRRPRQDQAPRDDEDPETPAESAMETLPPPIHAADNFADIVPPASYSDPYAEDWEAPPSDAKAPADPVPATKRVVPAPTGSTHRSTEDLSDADRSAVPLKDAVVFVPLSKEAITDTGVPSHLVVPYTGKAKSTSYYICTYPTCNLPKGFV